VGTAGATIDASGTSASASLSFTAAASPDFFETGGDRALTLTGNNPGPNVFGMAIPETGGKTSVNKSGTGQWVLTGASTYTGATNVTAGTLRVNGSLANTSVTVNGGAAIGGSGSIAGPVTVLGGGRVAPGAGVGTFTVASLSLAANAGLDLEFGATADLINVTTPGGLTINGGGINLFAEGGTAPFTTNGTYTIIDYDTSFTGAVGNFSVLNSQAGKFYNITDDAPSTSLRLTISDATINEWNTTAANGTWTTGANWTGGAPNAAGLVAKFGTIATTAATIATNGPKTVGGLLFGNTNG
jgi:fibronectin-binding autotransporter adhesin